jgi:hypothetical protein
MNEWKEEPVQIKLNRSAERTGAACNISKARGFAVCAAGTDVSAGRGQLPELMMRTSLAARMKAAVKASPIILDDLFIIYLSRFFNRPLIGL